MSSVLRVGFQNAIGGGVVSSSVHGIGAGLVKGRLCRLVRFPIVYNMQDLQET